MRRFSLIAIAGFMAFGLVACGGGGEDAATDQPGTGSEVAVDPNAPVDPNAAVDPNAPVDPNVAVDPNADPNAVPAQPASPPTVAVPSTPPPRGVIPPDLIGSTGAEQRARIVSRNRQDPFSLVPANPVIVSTPSPEDLAASPQTVPFATQPIPQGTASVPSLPATNGGAGASGGQAGNGAAGNGAAGNNAPTAVAAAPPPPPPQPTLARGVAVLGVVQVGSTPHAIVQAPNESTSRYVRVGQSLSNGQVLVKRIDMQAAEPIVVFEQFGIEVPLAVGNEPPRPNTENGQTTASAPAAPAEQIAMN